MGTVQTDIWTPQRWPHADLLAMQARLDPARMTEYADEWRRVIDDVCAVFTRLYEALGGHLEDSWRGHAGSQALQALRRYIFAALDGLARCRSLADAMVVLSDAAGDVRAAVGGLDHVNDLNEVRRHYSEPAVAAANVIGQIPAPPPIPGAPASTAPAAFGADAGSSPPLWSSQAMRDNGFDAHGVITPMHTSGAAPPLLAGTSRLTEAPLPAATLNAATMPTTSSASAPAQPGNSAPPRGPITYLPLIGAAHPGGSGRDDGTGRRTPGYLITIDNGNELIGPLPKVAPPVLGEW